MVNFKLREEVRKDGIINMSRAWDKEKSESPTGIEPMTFRTPEGVSRCFIVFHYFINSNGKK